MRYLILVLMFLFGCSSQPVTCQDESCEDQMGVAPLVPGVPVVQVLPKIGWSQGADFQPGSGTQKAVFQANFPEAGNYTLQFNVTDPNTAATLAANDIVKTQAIITWKVNGNPVRRIVDIGNGVSVTGVGESVDVQVADVSSPASIVNRAKPINVTITCAPGTRAAVQQPPTISLPADVIGPGVTRQYNVPVGAISVFVAIFPSTIGGTIGAYQVQVTQQEQSAILKTYDPRQSDWVPLAAGATQIFVTTDAALAPLSVLTQVTFGIDG